MLSSDLFTIFFAQFLNLMASIVLNVVGALISELLNPMAAG